MATISKDNQVITLINVFAVEPGMQQKVADLLVEATEAVMNKLHGLGTLRVLDDQARQDTRQDQSSHHETTDCIHTRVPSLVRLGQIVH